MTSRRVSRRDGSAKMSDHRASNIQHDLEQLLVIGDSDDEGKDVGTEAQKTNRRKSQKIQYTRRTDDSKETNDDARSKKSARSRRSARERNAQRSNRSLRSSKDDSPKINAIDRKSSKSPAASPNQASPNDTGKTKARRKIQYRSKEPETAEERDRDARSFRSRESRGSRLSRRSLNRNLSRKSSRNDSSEGVDKLDKNGETNTRTATHTRTNSGLLRPRRNSTLKPEKPSLSMEEKAIKRNSIRKTSRRKSWSLDDFDDNDWSSDEDDVDDFETGLNDEEKATGGVAQGLSRRRLSRRASSGAIDMDMILGDPSRRAPLSRSKSNDVSLFSSDHRGGDYMQKPSLLRSQSQYTDKSKLEGGNDNPFGVTYQSFSSTDKWDPFASEGPSEENGNDPNDRRGKLRPTRSGGLLQTSSRDTISRLPVGANVRKDSSSNVTSGEPSYGQGNLSNSTNIIGRLGNSDHGDSFKTEREKQRRADYKKSIAAAAMAGRQQLVGSTPRLQQRHARTVQSSFERSVKQLEGAAQKTSDNLKVRRTRCSLASLSPGGRVGRNNSISIQDLMGGEKRATDIHSPNRLDRSPLVTTNTCESSPIVHAEDKIKNILHARKSRQRRRSDISKSLDHNISETMLDMNSRASFHGLPKGMENITVPLNDLVDTPEVIEKEGGRRRRRNSLTCLSPGRLKKTIDLSRDQRSRLTKNLENEKPPPTPKKGTNTGSFLNNVAFSPRSTSKKRLSGTSNTLRDKLRQRLQGVNYCDLNESTHSGESATKRNGMVSLLSIDDDDCTADESDEFGEVQAQEESLRRSKSRERRPRSKSSHGISRKQSDSGDRNDSSKKQHSKTKRRARSKSKGKRRSSRLLALENEEKISNVNSTSASKRGKRRPKSLRSNDASIISDDNTDGDYSIDSQSFALSSKSLDLDVNQRSQRPIVVRDVMDTSISSTENPAESPRCKKSKKRSKSRKTSLNMSSEEELSLGSHLESESTKKRFIEKDNLSQVTEERSHYTHESCEAQTILLQFDPTSASGNHVRSVNQNQAKKTSESISGLHGTTSTLEIAEIAGLPSFEKLKTCDSTSTTAGESLSNSSRSSSPYLSMMNLSPKKQSIPRSSSCFSPKSPSMQTAGGLSFEGGSKNAEWNLAGTQAGTHTPYQRRGSIGRNIFFNKKSSNDGADKYEKPRRRGSIGAIEGNIFFNKKSTNDGADKYEKPTRRGSIGAIEGNIFFNKKSTNDGAEKYEKPARRGSIDKPTRRSSIGPMMRLGGRFKTRDNENPFGDAESLLSSEF